MHSYLQNHAHKSELYCINNTKLCIQHTVWNFKRLHLTIVSYFFSMYFLCTLSSECFWKQLCTMHYVAPPCTGRECGLCFKKFHEQLSLFFQCDIMRHNEIDVALNHRVLKLETSETLSTVWLCIEKHYGRKWGHLKITVHPIIITTK